jgi:hypothetical protein
LHRKYVVMNLAILIIIIGIIFTIFLTPKNTENPEPDIALAPYTEFEGTVVSLSLDNSVNYSEGSTLASAPNDSAVIKINRIIDTGGSEFDWASLGIIEGQEVALSFKYTARPARIITVVGKTIQNGDVVSHTPFPTQITFENGYFVFKIDGNAPNETNLPGLNVGSKFKAKIWYTYELKIEEYEIIN